MKEVYQKQNFVFNTTYVNEPLLIHPALPVSGIMLSIVKPQEINRAFALLATYSNNRGNVYKTVYDFIADFESRVLFTPKNEETQFLCDRIELVYTEPDVKTESKNGEILCTVLPMELSDGERKAFEQN